MALTNAILVRRTRRADQVGGLLDLPHGVLNAVLLPHAIRFNAQAALERFVPLAAAGGVRIEGVPARRSLLLAERVRGLADEVGVPKRLAALGVSEDAPSAGPDHFPGRLPGDQPPRGERRRYRGALLGCVVMAAPANGRGRHADPGSHRRL